jgi:hypothetical protein
MAATTKIMREEKPNQFISRIDKFYIRRYYTGLAGLRTDEILFHPSEYGMQYLKDTVMSESTTFSKDDKEYLIRMYEKITGEKVEPHSKRLQLKTKGGKIKLQVKKSNNEKTKAKISSKPKKHNLTHRR